jgi:hypothetical protein
MAWRSPARAWYAVLLSGAFVSARLGLDADRRLIVWPVDGMALYGQSSDDDEEEEQDEDVPTSRAPRKAFTGGGSGPKTYQRLQKTATHRAAAYGFQNFNRDRIEISYQIPEREFRPYNDSFGYTKEGIAEIKEWRENARQSSYKIAVKTGRSQAQLDAAIAAIDKEYDAKIKEYLASHGFRMLKGNVVTVDMPALVRKNAPLIKPLALSFEKIAAQNRYRSPEIIGAVLSFAQSAMYYKQPDPVYKNKHTGGVLPPITSVVVGWGDCDTKTGLMGSILSNWSQMRMVGVGVPGHYLMGVLLIPEKGDLFLEYQGLQYVLVEPAGPAWMPPGQVGEETMHLLNSREGYKIEPFF